MARKYVIDGGAYSGKTSVIKELARRGFATVPEAATLVIREQLACGGGLLPWVRREEFDHFLLGRVKLLESKIETEDLAFLDRSFPGGIAYSQFYRTSLLYDYVQAAQADHYAGVYLMDLLPGYKVDKFRKESPAARKQIHELIRQAYLDLGYKITRVQAMPVDERVDFINRHCLNPGNFISQIQISLPD